MTLRSLLTVIATFASIVFTPLTTAADELADVTRLRREGQPAPALAKAEQFLVAQPKDAQMRFARASLLVDLKRSSEAIAALESLNEDYPDLAESYNNVAVLYASLGEYAKARSALENLGYSPGEVRVALSRVEDPSASIEEVIKAALQVLA